MKEWRWWKGRRGGDTGESRGEELRGKRKRRDGGSWGEDEGVEGKEGAAEVLELKKRGGRRASEGGGRGGGDT